MLNKLELLYNVASTTKIPIVDDEQYNVNPESASYTIYNPGGGIHTGPTSAVVSGTYATVTFPSTGQWLQGWRIEVTSTSGSLTWYNNIYVDTVKQELRPLLTDDDLFDAYPILTDKKWTGETDWRRQKQLAWDELFLSIKARGFRPALTNPTSEELRQAHLNLTLANIFRGMFVEPGDRWYILYELHMNRYATTFEQAMATLKYDTGESLTIGLPQSVVALDLYR